MKKSYLISIFAALAIVLAAVNWANSTKKQNLKERINQEVNSRVDNNRYWKEKAKEGLAILNPDAIPEKAVFTGSKIKANSVATLDSPDVPLTEINSTQSENSVFVDPNNPQNILNSNNSTQNPVGSLYGANDLYSFDFGENWEGEVEGTGGSNSGDPSVVIGNNGRWYVNYIASDFGQGISYSDDNGTSWTKKTIAAANSAMFDKNHLWIDNSLTSAYEGNLYNAWTDFGGANDNNIAVTYSSDDGNTWSTPVNVSAAVNAGSHNQGVNLSTGPNGEVYAIWAIYDSWPSDESAIGFAKSLDGGASWEPAVRIIDNIRGIRTSETSKNMRVNSFPSAVADISNGENSGTVYVTWANNGVPGVNTGSDIDVYLIKSTNNGAAWSDPIKVNQDEAGNGKEHYFPWIACDPANGAICFVFYDDRNVSTNQCEVFCANSYDGGETFEDFKVSDVAFTPQPIANLADGYFGDYLGITAQDSWVYPVWTDNRSGEAMTYTSPYVTNMLPAPANLEAVVAFESGQTDLSWEFDGGQGFQYFILYRDGLQIGTTTDLNFVDMLPDYGIYQFGVSAFFDPDGESMIATATAQWGDATIEVNPDEINATLLIGESSNHIVTVYNIGQLDLHVDISPMIQNKADNTKAYCDAGAATIDDEYIQNVEFGDINNPSNGEGYQDFTDLSTIVETGKEYPITVTNGTPTWEEDQCGIWIDWNQNEDFTDDEPINVIGSPGTGPYTAMIQPPSDALAGETRMRIRITYSETPNPCGYDDYGEVEDYTVFVSNWISIDQSAGDILPGDSMKINIELNAAQLELGNYSAQLAIANNDPDNPEVIVPINLSVVEFDVEATATPDHLCVGEENVQLNAEIFGGTGSSTFSWTSVPVGFISDEQNPIFEPVTETTTFTVIWDNDGNQATDAVTVIVYPLPEFSLGDDIDICAGEEHTFMVPDGFASYLWQDGSTGSNFTTSESGTYWVEITNENGCSKRDSVELFVLDYPVVDLGADTTVCAFMEIVLDAGEHPDYTYRWMEDEATTPQYIVDSTGVGLGTKKVWVEVSNKNLCSSSDTILISFKDCTGIPELSSVLEVAVFPNPTDGVFKLKFNTNAELKVNVSIVNQIGKVVLNKKQLNLRGEHIELFDISAFSKGLYNVTIESNNSRISKNIILK
jgi:GEVED domain-containing protein/type IX secretion system substrate protein